ncbi:hypothetical protein BAOM_4613 [Peribacillus asahii]|uniref:Uncharacterized protein n=1 Tax=Peribacillus asahii TaxID=228899 RepID=A0A3Q9RRI7_9BACI|nr:hypothetical protein [Peribacillus asahii]AZV45192.1 hypothetical protein BAOM_4613 [Peribacillus asahii]
MGKRDKHHRRSLNDLLERFESASEQIQEEISDIRELLRRAERLMQQLPRNGNRGTQGFISDEGVFFEVAAPPAATPAAPVLTPDQRRLVRDIREIGRQLRNLQFQFAVAVVGFSTLIDLLVNEDEGDIPEEVVIAFISFFAIQISTIQLQIAELQGRLLATVLELEVSLGL